jgi:hypothetical protein
VSEYEYVVRKERERKGREANGKGNGRTGKGRRGVGALKSWALGIKEGN